TPETLLPTLRLAEGYTRYWSGDLSAASAAFGDVIAADPAARAADDARYALALTRSRLGDTGGASSALGEMTNGPTNRHPTPGALVDLDPRTMLRATFRHYRHTTLAEAQTPSGFINGVGPELARASVRHRHAHSAARRVVDDHGTPAPGRTG